MTREGRHWRARLVWGVVAGLSATMTACSANLGAVPRSSGRATPPAVLPLLSESNPSGVRPAAWVPARGTGPASDQGAKAEKGHESPAPLEKISLPAAVQLCLFANLRLQADAERVRQAEADLVSESLIPNPSLFVDAQLLPLQTADFHNQIGPPQYDAITTIPIDWWLFGKRAAAVQAARLGVDVARAEHEEFVRQTVANVVDVFYEVLGAQEFLKLAEEELEELKQLQELVGKQVEAGRAGAAESDWMKLAVLEATLRVHARELALAQAKARMRPLIGRTAADPDFALEGSLTVRAVVPVPELAEALRLADAHRPNLHAGLLAVSQAQAAVVSERRRGRPTVAVAPGFSYQDQRHITGFRNGTLFNLGLTTSLPVSDRNQGNVARAEATLRQKHAAHHADVADVRAEVEAVLAEYTDAVEDITENNDPETLKAAFSLRDRILAGYKAGGSRLVEVLGALAAHRERVARAVEFETAYWRMLNKLNAAVGLRAYDPETRSTQPVNYSKAKK